MLKKTINMIGSTNYIKMTQMPHYLSIIYFKKRIVAANAAP